MKIKLYILSLTMAALGFANPSQATIKAVRAYELYQTTPIETDLALPDLRTAQEVWIDAIRSAHQTIELAHFYISGKSGEPLDAVIDELRAAGTRGVKIRFLVSKELLSEDPDGIKTIKSISGLELRVIDFSKIKNAGGILHAKYFIVDGKTLLMGSQNFDWRALRHIHETGIKIEDETLTRRLLQVFEIDWKLALNSGTLPALPEPPKNKGGTPAWDSQHKVELVSSLKSYNPPGMRWSLTALLDLIKSAKTSIRFQVLSYSRKGDKNAPDWTEIDGALRKAAARGVSVEMLVSDWNTREPGISHIKDLSKLPGFTVKMASIPEWSGGFIKFARVIHTKMLIVDDETLWVGTSNWSKEYFYASRNIEMIVHDSDLAKKGTQIFQKVFDSKYAEAVDPNHVYTPVDPSKPKQRVTRK